jgi:hypothetical protein
MKQKRSLRCAHLFQSHVRFGERGAPVQFPGFVTGTELIAGESHFAAQGLLQSS